MNEQEIIGLLKEALNDVAPDRSADFESITLEASIEDLELDSVSTMEMVGFLEERTDVIFPDEELARVTKLGDLAALIRGERITA